MDEFTFNRGGEEVTSRRISAENLNFIAQWCGGEVKQTSSIGPDSLDFSPKPYIEINEDDIAFVGDWVVNVGAEFWAYTDSETMAVFAPFFSKEDKFGRVREIIRKALLEQDAKTYKAKQILKLF